MIKKLTDILPILIIGLIAFVMKGPKKPDLPEMPDPDSVPLALVEQMEPEPEIDPEPVNEPEPEPEPEQPDPVEISSGTTQKTLSIGGKFSAILNKTSWSGLMDQTFSDSGADALIDMHFNKYRGKNSGPLMVYSNEGKELARALQREFIEIYEENGWVYDKEFDLRRMDLAITNRGDQAGKPVVVSEFGYVDDPRNPIAEYIQTLEGQKRIARAYRNAVRDLDLDSVMLSIGHHGDRGNDAAMTGSYSEQNFAIDVITAIYNLNPPAERGGEADGYHHLAEVAKEYTAETEPDTPKTPEQIVFRATGPNLRIPADTDDSKPEPRARWIEVKPRTYSAPSSSQNRPSKSRTSSPKRYRTPPCPHKR